MLTRHDVGHRVVIRRALPVAEGRARFADVVGELLGVTRGELSIRTTRGDVLIPHAEVDVAKRIPDQRPLSTTGRLERIAAAGWPAPDVSHLGDWVLRAAAGWTARGNSALAIGHPDRPLPDAVDAVTAWYQSRDLQPAIMVPEPIGGRVTAELTSRGWRPDPAVLVQTADLGRLAVGPPAAADPPTVLLDPAPSATWLALIAGYKGVLPDVALDIITGVPTARFAVVHAADGAAIAAGRGVIAADGTWLGVSLLTVAPAARRRGLATAVVAALVEWAVGAGATRAYLQVEQRNTGAVELYERFGFSTHHRYLTWRP